ncbi:MAG: M23 family metallopeptidase [Clostridia bacterium]|nr:M23 family metallopeptidase [Clostridia bacterium]
MDKIKLDREQLKEKILERSRELRTRYNIQKDDEESGTGDVMLKKLGICVVIVLIVLLIKSINTPFTQSVTDGIRSVITSSFDIEKNIGKLKFVDEVFPNFTQKISQVFSEEQGDFESSEDEITTEDIEQEQVNSGTHIYFIAPLEGSLQRKFGKAKHPIYDKDVMNYGIDIAGEDNSPVFAVYDGEVVETGTNNEYKNYIKIKHEKDTYTIYSNCSNILVQKGDIVKQSDIIGNIGKNSYLHFEVIVNQQRLDPLKFIKPENKIVK